MKREWVDPRDGKDWVVTMLPFGYRGSSSSARNGSEQVTIAFHRPGSTPIWTRCDGADCLDRLSDRRLMEFLDRASRVKLEASLRLLRR